MDPFLPGEIPLMVMRYLAANRCQAAVLTLIEEMPILKAYIPPKPANVSDTDYVKHLARSSMTPGLKEVLTDYGNSKILAEELLDNTSILPMMSSDSLLTKLNTIQEILKTSSNQCATVNIAQSLNTNTNDKSSSVQTPSVVMVEQFTNTSEDYQCPTCISLRQKMFTESSCQTEEFTTVQFGLKDEIPILFCKTLLSDNNLQDKIAQTINEHISSDRKDGQPESVYQIIASKTETEIDKFLVDFLHDIPDDSNGLPDDFTLSVGNDAGGPLSSFAEVERNMNLMFQETNINLPDNQPITSASDKSINSNLDQLQDITAQSNVTGKEPTSSANLNSSAKLTPPALACTTPLASNQNLKCSELLGTISDDSSSISSQTSSARRRTSSVKRITPTPIPAIVNPVFKTSVVVEKQTVDFGDKKSQLTVIRTDIDQPAWNKLSRKSIQPKIPGLVSTPVQPKVRVIKKDATDQVINFKGPNRFTNAKVASKSKPTKNISTPLKDSSQVPRHPTSSQKKRKTVPIKLSPEKAKDLEYNFMHFYNENSKSSSKKDKTDTPSVDNASEMEQPSVEEVGGSSSVPEKDESDVSTSKPTLPPVVTPMPAPLPANINSDLKTISPNALKRLITSASKLCNTSASSQVVNFINKRKSFSTPRKRKHVRSLTFATPPSLKGVNPGNGNQVLTDPRESLKRKAEDDFHSAEFKSKKRLNWPDSVKKSAKDATVTQSGSEESSKVDINKTSNNEQILAASDSSITLKLISSVIAAPSMPTILEESLSNTSLAANADSQQNQGAVVPPSQTIQFSNVESPPRVSVIYTSDGIQIWQFEYDDGKPPQYYQLGEDMKTLIPVTIIHEPLSNAESVSQAGMPIAPPQNSASEKPINEEGSIPTQLETTPAVSSEIQNSHVPVSSNSIPGTLQNTQLESQAAAHFTPPQLPLNRSKESESDKAGSCPTVSASLSPISSVINSVAKGNCSKSTESAENMSSSFNLSISSSSSESTPSNVVEKPTPKRRQSTRTTTQKSEVKKDEKKAACKPSCKSKSKAEKKVEPLPPDKEVESITKQGSKRTRSKSEKQKETKKPTAALMFEIFGESPAKLGEHLKTPNNSKDRKLPADFRAAQSVAAEAVPLGTPRRSPRKHASKTPQGQKSVPQKVSPTKNVKSDPVALSFLPPSMTVSATLPSIFSPLPCYSSSTQDSQSQPKPQENITFNIVPAPLGFPEPTPVKNFAETGFLNVSEICGFNSPLITPLKSIPPCAGMNETQFTLPPTPRMIEDTDSNSNSNYSLKLDGILQSFMLTSTPMKPGLPRTPGRCSSSSNSHSPIANSGKVQGCLEEAAFRLKVQPPPLELNLTESQSTPLEPPRPLQSTHSQYQPEKTNQAPQATQAKSLSTPLESNKTPQPPHTKSQPVEPIQLPPVTQPNSHNPLSKHHINPPSSSQLKLHSFPVSELKPQPPLEQVKNQTSSEPIKPQSIFAQVIKRTSEELKKHSQPAPLKIQPPPPMQTKPQSSLAHSINRKPLPMQPAPQRINFQLPSAERRPLPPPLQQKPLTIPLPPLQQKPPTAPQVSEGQRHYHPIPQMSKISEPNPHSQNQARSNRRSESDSVSQISTRHSTTNPKDLGTHQPVQPSILRRKPSTPVSESTQRNNPVRPIQGTPSTFLEKEKSTLQIIKTNSEEKSDGELSSSDEEEAKDLAAKKIPSKPRIQMPKTLPPPPASSLTIISSADKNLNSIQPKEKLNPQQHPSSTQPQPNLPISTVFAVSGRTKTLTASEEASLYTLLKIGEIPKQPFENKREISNRPIGTASVISQNYNDQQEKVNKTKPEQSNQPYSLLKNKNIHDLIKLARKKKQCAEPQSS